MVSKDREERAIVKTRKIGVSRRSLFQITANANPHSSGLAWSLINPSAFQLPGSVSAKGDQSIRFFGIFKLIIPNHHGQRHGCGHCRCADKTWNNKSRR